MNLKLNLDQEIIYNFMSQEAFKTMQNAKAAFIGDPPNIWGSLFMLLLVLALAFYGINKTRPPR